MKSLTCRRIKGLAVASCLVLVCMVFLQKGVSLPRSFTPQGERKIYDDKDKLNRRLAVADQTAEPANRGASYTVLKHDPKLTQSEMAALAMFANLTDEEPVDISDSRDGTSSVRTEFNSVYLRHDDYQTTTADPRREAEEQEARIANLKSQCNTLNGRNELKEKLTRRNITEFYYSKMYNFAYCKVPKSGSTFWMKLLMVLLKGDSFIQVLNRWSRHEIHRKTRMLVASPLRIIHNNVRTIIVSRNPFTRLYSAYVDKVFLPLFWERFAKMEGTFIKPTIVLNCTEVILKGTQTSLSARLSRYSDQLMKRGMLEQRNVSKKIVPICANHVTFEQFITFVLKDSVTRKIPEPHWAPISSLCHPCLFNTYKIVKQEDFSHDVEHTLKSMDISLDQYPSIHDSLYENRARHSIPGILGVVRDRAFSLEVKQCLTHNEVLARAWHSLQIQGFIRDSEPLPDSLRAEGLVNKHKVTAAILAAINRNPMTPQERHQQRQSYLVNAYKSVSNETIKQIQFMYRYDFMLFNYSTTPPS